MLRTALNVTVFSVAGIAFMRTFVRATPYRVVPIVPRLLITMACFLFAASEIIKLLISNTHESAMSIMAKDAGVTCIVLAGIGLMLSWFGGKRRSNTVN